MPVADPRLVSTAPRTGERRTFARYREQATALARRFVAESPAGACDEQALPAYSHPRPLMRWLFWQRLWRVSRWIDRHVPASASIVDFGCGAGMLLPLIDCPGRSFAGVDIDFRWTADFLNEFGVDARLLSPDRLSEIPPGSQDLAVALDVLEHVDDLEGTIDSLLRLLGPGGRLIVCGPTENALYRLGRRLAGFDGRYHCRNVDDIERAVRARAKVRVLATLYPLAPLFRIFVAQPR